MLSDGRFAVFGGHLGDISSYFGTSSCEVLSFGADEHWTPLHLCTRCVSILHAQLWLNASLSLVVGIAHQPTEVYDDSTRRSANGYGFRAICLIMIGYCVMGSALM